VPRFVPVIFKAARVRAVIHRGASFAATESSRRRPPRSPQRHRIIARKDFEHRRVKKRRATSRRLPKFTRVPAEFKVFSGDDSMTLPVIAVGGVGLISVAANEAPRWMTA